MYSAGLDFGNKNCVVGVPSNGGIDVITDQASNRLIPTIVSYSNEKRFFGDSSLHQIMNNVSGTINQIKRLFCLPYDSPERELLQNLSAFRLVKLNNGYTGVSVMYGGKETILRPEQCFAFLLRQLLYLSKEKCPDLVSFVVAVSPWWTEWHRRAVFDSFRIAQVECMSLVNSTTAAAITYCMSHRNRLPKSTEESVPIVFIDLGDSSLNVAVALLKQGSVEIKSFSYDEHLGGSHFTDALVQYLLPITEKKYSINPANSQKAMIRFYTAAEKLKKNLTINPIVSFEIPSLMNDIDISFLVKREEFENQITGLVDRIHKPIIEAISSSKIEISSIFCIELLGGGSRIPVVKAKVSQIFGREPSLSLNLDECFAVGSGYMAAVLSPNLKVPLIVKDISPHEFSTKVSESEDKSILFPRFSDVPSMTTMNLTIEKPTSITFFCQNNPIGILSIPFSDDKPIDVSIEVSLTQSCTLSIDKVFSIINSIDVPIKCIYQIIGGLSSEQISEYIALEDSMSNNDYQIERIEIEKNELEAMIYSSEKALSRDMIQYFDPSKLSEYQSHLNQIHQWFMDNDGFASFEEYQSRKKIINEFLAPSQERKMFFSSINDLAITIIRKSNEIQQIINSHSLSSQTKQKLLASVNSYMTEFNQMMEYVKSLAPHQNPPKTIDMINNEISQLESSIISTINNEKKDKSGNGLCLIL